MMNNIEQQIVDQIQTYGQGDTIQIRATKTKLRTFLFIIMKRLNSRYTNDQSLSGYKTYLSWIDNGIAKINNRFELRKIVIGSTAAHNEQSKRPHYNRDD